MTLRALAQQGTTHVRPVHCTYTKIISSLWAEITELAQAATPGLANLQNSYSAGVYVEKHRCFAMVEEHKSLVVIVSKDLPPF